MNFFIKFLFVVFAIGCVDQLFGYIPTQVTAFKNAVQNGTKNLNCASCDFRGTQDLAGLNAQGIYAPGVNFQPCVSNAVNQTTPMVCIAGQVTDLTGFNGAQGKFFSSCFDAVTADNADFTGADFTNSSAQSASFKGAKIAGIITTNATFCNAIMPDGSVCTDTWTGQGVTIQCNCTGLEPSATPAVASTSQPATTTSTATATASASTPTPAVTITPQTTVAPAA